VNDFEIGGGGFKMSTFGILDIKSGGIEVK
jgi:hypothetical protein